MGEKYFSEANSRSSTYIIPECSLPCSLLVSVLSQMNTVHAIRYYEYFFQNHQPALNGLYPTGPSTKILYAFLFPPMRATCLVYFFLLNLIILIIFGEEYKH
jgi:hypothetical protein